MSIIFLFRGDSRSPKEIFETGFQPLSKSDEYTFKPMFGSESHLVAMTDYFPAAARFPLDQSPSTWIYIIAVDNEDPENYYDLLSRSLTETTDPAAILLAATTYEAREHAVTQSLPHNILCAFPIERFSVKQLPQKFKIINKSEENPKASDLLKKDPTYEKIRFDIDRMKKEKEIDIPVWSGDNDKNKRRLHQCAFFMKNRLEHNLVRKEPDSHPPGSQNGTLKAFLAARSYVNPDGILFDSPRKLAELNYSFFSACKRINLPETELANMIDTAIMYRLDQPGASLDFAKKGFKISFNLEDKDLADFFNDLPRTKTHLKL